MACANANAPHTNGSQFFITLDRTDGLNKKNTIFGKVTGDTIYNLANMNELEVDDADRCHNLGIMASSELTNLTCDVWSLRRAFPGGGHPCACDATPITSLK